MCKPLFTLTRSQRDDMERRYKQTHERRISERIQAILLLDAGHNRDHVARILHGNPKTITRWVHVFVRAGIDTLCTMQAGGNDPILTMPQQEQLMAWLDTTVCRTKEVIAWVETTFAVSSTESGMRKLLHRLDDRYKQPAQVPSNADPKAQAAWLTSYAEKRGSSGQRVGALLWMRPTWCIKPSQDTAGSNGNERWNGRRTQAGIASMCLGPLPPTTKPSWSLRIRCRVMPRWSASYSKNSGRLMPTAPYRSLWCWTLPAPSVRIGCRNWPRNSRSPWCFCPPPPRI